MDSFKELLKKEKETVNDAMHTGQRIVLEALMREITAFNYDTISQVKGAINSHLDRLNEGSNNGN